MLSNADAIRERLNNLSPRDEAVVSENAAIFAKEFTAEELARLTALFHLMVNELGDFDDDIEEAVEVHELVN